MVITTVDSCLGKTIQKQEFNIQSSGVQSLPCPRHTSPKLQTPLPSHAQAVRHQIILKGLLFIHIIPLTSLYVMVVWLSKKSTTWRSLDQA